MSLQVAIRESGDVAILDLRGRSTISGGESQLLSSHIQKLVADGKRKLLLNLTDLTQVDSTGVSIIARTSGVTQIRPMRVTSKPDND